MLHTAMDSRTIFGLLGNITTFIVFLSPARVIYKIHRSPNGRPSMADAQYSAFTYQCHVAMICCLLWMWYNESFLVIISSIGFVMEFFYLGLFVRTFMEFMNHFFIILFEMFLVLYVLDSVALAFVYPAKFSGTICMTGSIVMCVVKMVYGTERAPDLESSAVFANGVVWAVYALISSNVFILVPNLVWALLGLIQLVIHYKSPQIEGEEVTTHAEESTPQTQFRHLPDSVVGSLVGLAQFSQYLIRHRTLDSLLELAQELGIISPNEQETAPEIEMV